MGQMNRSKIDFDFIWLLYLTFLLVVLWAKISWASDAGVRTLKLCENQVGQILVRSDGTVINFPQGPQKVVPGNNQFTIQYVESDLALAPVSPSSRANLFVYLPGRRFTLHLKTANQGAFGDTVVNIRDCSEKQMRVKVIK